MKREREILKKATQALREQTGLEISYEIPKQSTRANHFIDANLTLYLPKKTIDYMAEIKTRLNEGAIGSALVQAKEISGPFALVSELVTPSQAERLRDLGLTFFDTAGNAYFNEPGLYVFVSGQKVHLSEAQQPLEIFSPAGMRLILALLTTPRLETFDYRTISDDTQIPRTNIGRVMSSLEKAGYLIRRGKQERFLINRKDLIKRWVEAYSESYRPKLKPIRYHSMRTKGRWWEDVDIATYNAVWGGETAAERLTKYLKPQTATIYADSKLTRLQAIHGLVNDEKGEVEILNRFWVSGEVKDCAPPLVVYADLLATADERNLEAARLIYDEYLAPLEEETLR